MKFWEAMKLLVEGKKVRATHWNPCVHMHLKQVDECTHMGFLYWKDAESEWELYEEPPKTYSFMEVVKGLKEGKSFKRRTWTSRINLCNGHICLKNEGFACYWTPLTEDFEATDWIEVK